MTESSKTTTIVQAGTPAPTLLTLLFVALKLTHVIGWSWVWVLSPIWITFGALILFLLILVVMAIVAVVRES